MQSYKDFCSQYPITRIDFKQKDDFITGIHFFIKGEHESTLILLKARAQCCSFSWFSFLNHNKTAKLVLTSDDSKTINYEADFIANIIGKYLSDVRIGESIDLPPSNVQEFDSNNIVQLEFSDGSHYEFVIRNSSNGYYSGWIDIDVRDSIYPPDEDDESA